MTSPMGGDRLRIGLIGLGSMGRNHVRVVAGHPATHLAAVADTDAQAVASVTSQAGALGFTDPMAMIAEAELDGVIIAAPTTLHGPLAQAAIARGLPILVEKPLAATDADARAIVAAGRQAGVPVQVGHVERYNPAVLRLGELLRAGWLTTIYAIVSRRAGPFPARIRDVGVTIDLATHDTDMLCWIAGERPQHVYAELTQRKHASHEDLLFGLLHFPSGTSGMLDVNWLTPAKRRQLIVIGEEGMFELDYLTQRLTFTKSDLANGSLISGYAPTFTGDVLEIDVETHEPLQAQLDAFVRTIRFGERPHVDGEDGAWAVRIAEALLEAATTMTPVVLGPDPVAV
jgi:predicted dehydrogenase